MISVVFIFKLIQNQVGYNGFLVADNNNNYDVSFSPINNSISNQNYILTIRPKLQVYINYQIQTVI